ncbi:MAG: CDP-glycerol glycerophosphotransferase family protein [Oscillospiraceae bacterium]|nr:CDP-glycerol glycerophosphotransferase family protein [Oscillospiraceae bacterium]
MKAVVKLIAIYCLRVVMYVMRIFPVKKGRVVFFSHHGNYYSCNPKYISEYLEKSYPGEFEIVWAFTCPEHFRELQDRGIKIIRYGSLARLYYEATAQVSINNIGSFSWMPLRKSQLHINTWHGGGCYKKVSLGEKKNDSVMKKTLIMTAQETSYMISTSKYFSEYVIPNDFGYNGYVLNCGFPRNDILINGDRLAIRKKVGEYFCVGEDCDLLLYAPTWRYEKKKEIILPNFKEIKNAYTERFGRECAILFRAHPWMLFEVDGDELINATDYPDMQELLLACDMLISDYSSCIWDYSLTYRPCLLFTPDLDEYVADRGFDVDIYEWGFPVCKTNESLCSTIRSIDDDKIRKAMEKHQNDLGSFERGEACERIGKLIYNFCFENNK